MRRITGSAFVMCVALALGVLGSPGPIEADPPEPPNVVVILTDDQTVADMQFMPKTSALIGQQGTTYVNSWTSLSWCCPSRATLQTGQHAHNHGVYSNALPAGGFNRFTDETALPVWLQAAGYRTIHIGKAMNDTNRSVPAGWDRWQATLAGDHKMYNWRTIDQSGRIRQFGSRIQDYQGDVYAQMAVDEIVATNDPFFMYFSLSAPHAGVGRYATPPKRHLKTVNDPLPRPPSFNIPANFTNEEIQLLQREYQRRAESLLGADDGIERIMGALDETGKLDNTVVIFTSDNGFLLGEHGAYGKATFWSEAMTVPLLIRGPGFDAGVIETAPVQNIDLAPTIAELTGATPLVTMDGHSLLQPLPDDRGLYFESKRDEPGTPLWDGVRSDRFILVDVFAGKQKLWDMHEDPWQLNDLIEHPAYDAVEDALEQYLQAARDCVGTDCFFEVDNDALAAMVDGPKPANPTDSDITTTTSTSTTSTTTTSTTTTTTEPPPGGAEIVVVPESSPWLAGFTVQRVAGDVSVTIAPLSTRTATLFQVRWQVDGASWVWEAATAVPSVAFAPSTGPLQIEVRVYGSQMWRPWNAVTLP